MNFIVTDNNQSNIKRSICPVCQRPQKACLCKWVQPVANQIEFIIFQHPSEAKNAKGTARLADLMLQRSLLWIGETLQEAYCDSVELAL